MRYFRISSCIALLLLVLSANPAMAGPRRTLKVVTLHSGTPGVQGEGWGHHPLTVSLQTSQWMVSATVRPNTSGTFRLAATGLNLCAGALFRVYDSHGHTREARGPALGCAAPHDPPRPTLRVVVGRLVSPPTVKVLATHPTSVTLHLGDILYLWEPGTTSSFWTPSAVEDLDPQATIARLVLVDQGQTSPRACAQVDCAAGFYWKWVAIATGDSEITLSAACRASKPPCMVPDFIVRVHVIP